MSDSRLGDFSSITRISRTPLAKSAMRPALKGMGMPILSSRMPQAAMAASPAMPRRANASITSR